MYRVLGAMINSYRRSPVKPLKGALLRAYSVYRLMNRNRTVVATLDGITYELDLNETIDSAIEPDWSMQRMISRSTCVDLRA